MEKKYGMLVCPYSDEVTSSLNDVRGIRAGDRGELWLVRNKGKVMSLMRHLKEVNFNNAKNSVKNLVKSAGLSLTSYDLAEIQEVATQHKADYSPSEGSITPEEIAPLVKSIFYEKGIGAKGLIKACELNRKEKMAPLIRKRRIWWEPVPGVRDYVVYVGKDRIAFEPDNFSWETTPGIISKVIGKTELIIPDDWPEFPTEPGTYHIGITARDDVGNQSKLLILAGLFKFVAPPTPMKGGIESL
jgi:hypothetical protein